MDSADQPGLSSRCSSPFCSPPGRDPAVAILRSRPPALRRPPRKAIAPGSPFRATCNLEPRRRADTSIVRALRTPRQGISSQPTSRNSRPRERDRGTAALPPGNRPPSPGSKMHGLTCGQTVAPLGPPRHMHGGQPPARPFHQMTHSATKAANHDRPGTTFASQFRCANGPPKALLAWLCVKTRFASERVPPVKPRKAAASQSPQARWPMARG